MKPTIQLRLGQHLTMTPQLQQAIKLLQLSTMDLQQEIQQALDSNPMLEMADDDNDSEERAPRTGDDSSSDGPMDSRERSATDQDSGDDGWDSQMPDDPFLMGARLADWAPRRK